MTTIEWLKNQCSRHIHGQCSALNCLRRGGYISGHPNYDAATCEAHEAASELSALQQQVKRTDDMYSVARALVADQAKDIEYLRTQNLELEEENENLSSELALRIGDKLEITTLGKQNRKLLELLTDVLKSSDVMWYEKKMGHDWNDCVDRINKAIALQPEK